MTAVVTAQRVLSWVARSHGAIPRGPLWDATALARPGEPVLDAAAELARRSAALLCADVPPFGDTGMIGLGVIFLAAAVGGRQQTQPAILLTQIVPAPPRQSPGAWYDLVARHGLVNMALPALAAESPLAEALLDASPLTCVLYRPTSHAISSGTTGQAVSTAAAMLGRPRGQLTLADGLAGWASSVEVLAWRAELLSRLRQDHPSLLLDVYLVARTRHGADWDNRVRWAERQLRSRDAPDPLAIATLRFWAPLAALQKEAGPVRALRPLMTGHGQALDLVRRFRLDQAGAA